MSKRRGLWPPSKLTVKREGISTARGVLEATLSKLRPYSLMAEDKKAVETISEIPATSATITDVFFINRFWLICGKSRQVGGVSGKKNMFSALME